MKERILTIVERADRNEISEEKGIDLGNIVAKNKNVLPTSFFPRPAAEVKPLKIFFVPDAFSTKVRIRNYS